MHDLVQTHSCGFSGWQESIGLVAQELDNKMNDLEWLNRADVAARS